jgi:hydrogenase maturation protein HypF
MACLAGRPATKGAARSYRNNYLNFGDLHSMAEISQIAVFRKTVNITGIVQGVGFRPFVYRLANACGLTGFIRNTPAGVSIEVEGRAERVDNFLERLPREIPPLAKITSIALCDADVQDGDSFRIVSSQLGEPPKALISPDVVVCEDCLREMGNPRDRRFRYPFINCTNCGPRFTIICDTPYDRARTSMASFQMCSACQAEYDDPASRRFHAQPNACWNCGPQVKLLSSAGERMAVAEPIRETARLLQEGKIVAVKGLGGFHLACDAKNEAAVDLLRDRKRRVEKPFAIMMRCIEDVERVCTLDDLAKKQLLSKQRQIVLLPRKSEAVVAAGVAPRNRFLGVFLPYTPLHHLLFSSGKFEALVMTSGNLSEEPIAIDNAEAVQRLRNLADAFLVHDRDILRRCDDSVMRVSAGLPQLLRRSRGYVPVPVALESASEPILAVGDELKNTICVVRGPEAFLSQHLGDLENLESYGFFDQTIAHFQRILEVQPTVIAHDLHPDYFSTKWALEREDVEHIPVQHHHAHIAACGGKSSGRQSDRHGAGWHRLRHGRRDLGRRNHDC